MKKDVKERVKKKEKEKGKRTCSDPLSMRRTITYLVTALNPNPTKADL